jgi:hypothetical protein
MNLLYEALMMHSVRAPNPPPSRTDVERVWREIQGALLQEPPAGWQLLAMALYGNWPRYTLTPEEMVVIDSLAAELFQRCAPQQSPIQSKLIHAIEVADNQPIF